MSASRPDSAVIAEAFDTLRIQSERMANVVPLQNEQNIMGAIQTLGQEIAALGQQLAALGQEMVVRFDRLEIRQTNFEVAAVNARLLSLDTGGALQPLVDIRDGSDIPHFPATLIQLHTLDGMSV